MLGLRLIRRVRASKRVMISRRLRVSNRVIISRRVRLNNKVPLSLSPSLSLCYSYFAVCCTLNSLITVIFTDPG